MLHRDSWPDLDDEHKIFVKPRKPKSYSGIDPWDYYSYAHTERNWKKYRSKQYRVKDDKKRKIAKNMLRMCRERITGIATYLGAK